MEAQRQKVHSQTVTKHECPVCLQIPRANVFQCVNQHSICDICSTKFEYCPICQSSEYRTRNRSLERLLDGLQFKCSWSRRGCDKTMFRGELTAHEHQCDHR